MRQLLRRGSLGFALFLPLLAFAQAEVPAPQAQSQPAPQYGEEIEVRVIDIDVVVTDKQGNPLTNLTRDDFELYEDGKRVEVPYFTRIVEGRIADVPAAAADPAQPAGAAATAPATPRTPLTWIVYIDQTNFPPQRRNQAMRQLQTFLATAVTAGDRGVVAHNDGRVFKLRQGLTDDPKLLMDVLAAIEKERVMASPTMNRSNNIRNELNRAEGPGGGDREWEFIAQNIANDVNQVIEEEAVRTRNAINAMAALLDALAPLEGRLALVYVGAGFNTRPGMALAQAWNSKFQLWLRNESYVPDPDRHREPLTRDIGRLYSNFSAMRVTVYTIHGGDAGGVTSVEDAGDFEPSRTTDSGAAGLTEAGLAREMSDRTGGLFFKVNQTLAKQMESVRRDLSNYYSLGYRPTGSPADARRVKVKVKVDGARVRHRETVRERTRQEKATSAAVAAMTQPQPRVATKLQQQQPGAATPAADPTAANPLGVTVQAERPRPDGWSKDFVLPFRFSINLEALTFVKNDSVHRAAFAMHFALVGPDGSVYPLESRDQALAVPDKEMPSRPDAMVNYAWHVDLAPLKIPEDVPWKQKGMRLTVTVEDRTTSTRSVITVPIEK